MRALEDRDEAACEGRDETACDGRDEAAREDRGEIEGGREDGGGFERYHDVEHWHRGDQVVEVTMEPPCS